MLTEIPSRTANLAASTGGAGCPEASARVMIEAYSFASVFCAGLNTVRFPSSAWVVTLSRVDVTTKKEPLVIEEPFVATAIPPGTNNMRTKEQDVPPRDRRAPRPQYSAERAEPLDIGFWGQAAVNYTLQKDACGDKSHRDA